RTNQKEKNYKKQPEIKRFFKEEPNVIHEECNIIKMNIQTPKCLVGLKTPNPNRQGKELMKHELSVSLLLDYLFGKGSDNYQMLYEKGYIDNSFFFDYSEELGFGFGMIGGDTNVPDKLAEEIQRILFTLDNETISE